MSDERLPVLAVFGGSFNPPHLGHALLPGYLLARGAADRVLVAPCWDHPLGKSLASFERRMSWARLAIGQGDPRVEVSPIEAELAGEQGGRPSYTVELLEAVAARHPGARVRLVIGSDITASGETDRWHRWEEIVETFEPIVVPRVGWAEPGETALPEVSSTAVRELLERLQRVEGESKLEREAELEQLRTMVPAAVASALERWLAGDEPRIWVVGRGHVAHHAVPWLRDRGFEVAQIPARALVDGTLAKLPDQEPAGAWLLCRDPALPSVAAALVGRLAPGVPVLHAAGARLAAEVLAPLREVGHPVGTLHPICSLRRERARARLTTASFGLGGDLAARELGRRLVGDPARIVDISALDARARLAYHGACALVANHLAVLESRAAAVMRGLELSGSSEPSQTEAPVIDGALWDLMLGSLENLAELGIPAGVTGPLSRGDRATFEAHLEAIDDEATRSLYADLGERLAELLSETSSGAGE